MRPILSRAAFGLIAAFGFSLPPSLSIADQAAHPVSTQVGATVQLDPTSGLSLADPQLSRFEWEWVSRPGTSVAEFSTSNAVRPTVTLDLPGTYVAQVNVFAADDLTSDTPLATTTVTISTGGTPPLAVVQGRGIPGELALTLDGSASYDLDGDMLTYSWSVESAPSDGEVTFATPNDVLTDVTFTGAGDFVLGLSVQDATGLTSEVATYDVRTTAAMSLDTGFDLQGSLSTFNLLTEVYTGRQEVEGRTYIGSSLENITGQFGYRPATDGLDLAELYIDGDLLNSNINLTPGDEAVISGVAQSSNVNNGTLVENATDFPAIDFQAYRDQSAFLASLTGDAPDLSDPNNKQFGGAPNAVASEATFGPNTRIVNTSFDDLQTGGYSVDLSQANTIIINVSGQTGTFQMNPLGGTGAAENVLWNFYEATEINVNAVIMGHVLAPYAEMSGASGSTEGTVIVQEMSLTNGALHQRGWGGVIPVAVGSGGTGSDEIAARLVAPVAASTFAHLETGANEALLLEAFSSTDIDGDQLSSDVFLAAQPDGAAPSLVVGADGIVSFTGDLAGDYLVGFTVDDGVFSDTELVLVSVGSVNQAPEARIQSITTAAAGVPLSLDGTQSFDLDGDLLSYEWSVLSAPVSSAVTLTSSSPLADLTPDVPGTYVVQLVASDAEVSSRPATVVFIAGETLPIADASRDTLPNQDNTAQLDGTASVEAGLSYYWTSTGLVGAAGTFDDASLAAPIFTLPSASGELRDIVATQIVYELNRPDLEGLCVLDTRRPADIANPAPAWWDGVSFWVNGQVDGRPVWVINNHIEHTRDISLVSTDGTDFGTFSIPGLTQAYITTDALASGAQMRVLLDGNQINQAGPQDWAFNSTDAVCGGASVDVAQLIVSNGDFVSLPDTVFVGDTSIRPVLTVPATLELDQAGVVELTAPSQAFDANGDPLSYEWSLIHRPDLSGATIDADPALTKVAGDTLSFTPDAPGLYLVQLEATDGAFDAEPVVFAILSDNAIPIAAIDAPTQAFVGDTITLSGAGSFDPSGEAITFDWRVISAPAGSIAAIADPFAVSVPFTPDVKGQYVFQLIVSDFDASSTPVTAVLTVPNRAPVAVLAGASDVDAGSAIVFDATGSTDPDNDPLSYTLVVTSGPSDNVSIEETADGRFEVTADVAGDYVIELTVDDGEAQASTTASLTVLGGNNPPVLSDLQSPYTVETGLELSLDLIGTDPDGDALTYFATPVPLPTGMTLDVVTGALIFSPEAGQEGTYTLTVGVSDGLLTDEADITVEVISPTAGETAVAGRVLDALDYANGIETPLAGMPVRLGTDGQATVTGSDGSFGFTDLASGRDLVLVEPDAAGGPGGYLATQRPIRVTENQNRSINPDLLLVPLNEGCSIVTAGVATQLTGSSSGVQVTIPADTIFDASGDLYTGEVCLASLPRQTNVPGFPEDTLACQVFGVSAPGATFASGLELSAPNFDNLPETTELSLWQQSGNTGNFGRSAIANVDAGAATVSGTMSPIDGGTLFTFLPQSPRIVASADQPTGMHTLNMFEGDLNEMYTLPGYRAFNQTQQISLSYHSQSANPTVIVAGDVTIAPDASLPVTLSSRIEVGGLSIDDTIEWTPRQGLDGSTPALVGEEVVLRQSTPVDASELPSARYDYQFIAQAQYDCSTVEASFNAEFYVQNQSDSPYGTGWSIDELQTLVQNPDGSVAIIDDDTVTTFNPKPTLTEFVSEPLVFPVVGGDGIAAIDFQNDGLMDVTYAESGTGSLGRILNLGNGEFIQETAFNVADPSNVPQTGVYPPNLSGLAVGEFTNDGLEDVAYSMQTQQGYGIAASTGFGTLVDEFQLTSIGRRALDIAADDIDGDGFEDIIYVTTVGFLFVTDEVYVSYGGPTGRTQNRISRQFSGRGTLQVETGDVDGDGNIDIAYRTREGVDFVFNNGGRDYTTVSARVGNGGIDALGNSFQMEDFNGDGLLDIVYSTPDDLQVILNQDGRTFSDPVLLQRPPSAGGVLPVDLADANGDDLQDIIVTSGGEIHVYSSNGDGTFLPFESGLVDYGFRDIAIADFNGDGSLDMASAQRFSITIHFSEPTASNEFLAGAGEFSALTQLDDGTWERRYKDGMVVSYDVNGRQTATTDTYGNSTTYAYGTDGRLESKTDQVGGETLFAYGDAGRLASITYPDGRVTEFEYDDIGTLNEITEPIGSKVSFTYDDNGQLVSSTNQNGNTSNYGYSATGDATGANLPDGSSVANQVARSLGLIDGLGNELPNPLIYVAPEDRITTVTDRKGEITEIEVNQFGATVRVTDPIGRITNITRDDNNLVRRVDRPSATGGRRIDEMDYDNIGNVTLMTEAVGTDVERSTQYEYENTFSKVISMTDPDGFTSTYEYDGFGQPSSMTDPEGGIMGYAYSEEGQMLSRTDENGNETTYAYDDRLNMSEMTYADGSITQLVYDVTGNNTVQMDAVGTPEERHQIYTFDTLNRILTAEITGADGVQIEGITSFNYAPNGNLSSVTDETDLVTIMTYDRLERLIAVDDPAQGLTQRIYNEAGEVTTLINSDGETHLYRYDSVSRMTETTDAGGFIKSVDYDDLDNITLVTDGRDGATSFTYDVLNRIVDRTNPLGLTISQTYDLRNNLISLTRQDGLVETASYDGLTRLTEVITPDNTLRYDYDPRSNLTEAADDDSRVTFTYDERNRLASTTTDGTVGPQPEVTISYTYDLLDRRVSMSDSFGGTTTYAYDFENRLTDLTAPWGTIYNFGYDDVGRRTSLTSSTARASTYSYQNGLLATLNHVQSGVALSDLAYGYDVDGQLTSITDNLNPSASWAISYDDLNRLVQVSEGVAGDIQTPIEDYAYDEEGNRDASHLSAFYRSNAHNQLEEDDSYIYTYDDRGNRITRTEKASGVAETYSYDSQNRLIGYTSDVTTASYAYDALDRRAAKTVNGVETAYVYDGGDVLFDYVDTVLSTRWQHGANVDEPLGFERYATGTTPGQGETYEIYPDRLGSPLEIVNASLGTVATSYDYDSFGRRSGGGTVEQRYGFTGREWDEETGYYYYRARHYDPLTGSFVQRDPIGFAAGDHNLYAYVWNDPHNWSDPSGLSSTAEKGVLFGGLLLTVGACHYSGVCGLAADFLEGLFESGTPDLGAENGSAAGNNGAGNSPSAGANNTISPIARGLGLLVGYMYKGFDYVQNELFSNSNGDGDGNTNSDTAPPPPTTGGCEPLDPNCGDRRPNECDEGDLFGGLDFFGRGSSGDIGSIPWATMTANTAFRLVGRLEESINFRIMDNINKGRDPGHDHRIEQEREAQRRAESKSRGHEC